jgi:hypothetical protein
MLGWSVLCVCIGAVVATKFAPAGKLAGNPWDNDPIVQPTTAPARDIFDQVAAQQQTPDALSKRLFDLEQHVESLQEDIDVERQAQTTIDYILESPELNINDTKFTTVRTSNGTLLFVECDQAEPYLQGYRLHLHLGNPLYAKIYGVTLHIHYGPQSIVLPNDVPISQWIAAWKSWQAAMHTMDISLPNELPAASWTPVVVTLSPCAAQDLHYVAVGIDFDNVELSGATNH